MDITKLGGLTPYEIVDNTYPRRLFNYRTRILLSTPDGVLFSSTNWIDTKNVFEVYKSIDKGVTWTAIGLPQPIDGYSVGSIYFPAPVLYYKDDKLYTCIMESTTSSFDGSSFYFNVYDINSGIWLYSTNSLKIADSFIDFYSNSSFFGKYNMTMVVDDSGEVFIFTSAKETGGGSVDYFLYCNRTSDYGSTWSGWDCVRSHTNRVYSFSACIDYDGNCTVVYFPYQYSSGYFKQKTYDGGWPADIDEVTINQTHSQIYYTSMRVQIKNIGGTLYLYLYDSASTPEHNFLKNTGSGWTLMTCRLVSSLSGTVFHVDQNEWIHMCYYNSTSNRLHYTVYNNSSGSWAWSAADQITEGLTNNDVYPVMATNNTNIDEFILMCMHNTGSGNYSIEYYGDILDTSVPSQDYFWILASDEKPRVCFRKSQIMRAVHTHKISGQNTLNFWIPVDDDGKSAYFLEGNYVAYWDTNDDFQLFEIVKVTEHSDYGGRYKKGYCEHNFYELIDNVVEDWRAVAINASVAILGALTGSRWGVGTTDNFGKKNSNVYYKNSLSALQDIRDRYIYTDADGKTAKGQLVYTIDIDTDWSMSRYVDFIRQIGTWDGKRYVGGKDLLKIKREVDMTEVYTGAYAFGKSVEITNEGEDEGKTPNTGDSSYSERLLIGVSKQFPSGLEWIKALSEITNGDFTDGMNDWDTNVAANIDYDVVDDATGMTLDGGYACKITKVSAVDYAEIKSDFVEVEAGKTYSCRINMHADSIASVLFKVDWYTDAEVFISTGEANAGFYITDDKLDMWRLYEITEEAPATAKYGRMYLSIGAASTGIFHIDRCRFGHYTDKPATQKWMGDADALAMWGRNSGTQHRMGIYTNNDITDATILAQLCWQFIQDHKEPKIAYECDMADLSALGDEYDHESVNLGDLVLVIDDYFSVPLEVTARIIGLKKDLLLPENTTVELANYITSAQDLAQRQTALENKIDERSAAWDNGSVFEQSANNVRRVKVDSTKEGHLQSQIRYEDSDGNLFGYLSDDRFVYKTIHSDNFVGQNIITTQASEISLYVDSYAGDDTNDGSISHPFKTLQRLNGEAAIPKILKAKVDVYIQDTNPGGAGNSPYNEHTQWDGILGAEFLEIHWGKAVRLNGSLQIRSCSVPIYFHGESATFSPFEYGIICATKVDTPSLTIYNCKKIRIRYMWISANSLSGNDAVICDSSQAILDNCVLELADDVTKGGVYAKDTAHVSVESCIGSNGGYGTIASDATFLGVSTTRPSGTVGGQLVDNSSLIQDTGTATPTASPGAISVATTQSTLTCECSDTASWDFEDDRWRTDNDYLYQGRNLTESLHAAFLEFQGTYDFDDVVSKVIKSATLHIKRLSGGGNARAQDLHLWGCTSASKPSAFDTSLISTYDYGVVASIKWGEELIIDLPTDFTDDITAGNVDSLVLYEADGDPYMILNGYTDYAIKVVFEYEP
jgi:phage minor structural protein